MFDEALTPEQLVVVNALSEGLNSTDAAAQAGVHRNTIANWRCNSLFFREALADAQYDRALLVRDRNEERLVRAFAALDSILDNPEASPSVRLKAALSIIDKAMTPPPPRKHVPFDIEEIRVHHAPARPAVQNVQIVHKVHNDAQPPAPAPVETSVENPLAAPQNAQTIRREGPKVGRNDPCPCRSGQKYKHCCMNKPQSRAA